MFIDQNGNMYGGEMRVGDREATPEEVAAWNTARVAESLPAPGEASSPMEKLQRFLDAN